MHSWFSDLLVKWYHSNKRDLPWRGESDPYRIWLSEIILQQTQVAQGTDYYHRFIHRYPTVQSLAAASEDEVLKLWQGLGYYSRARNMRFAAQQIVSEHSGIFPYTYNEIRKLKGVGDYTAAAIASFAFNIPKAVVDGNVYRFLGRLFGVETACDTTPGKKEYASLAELLLNKKNPAVHNQAIMEFGSRFCRPSNPDCNSCVFSEKCVAYGADTVSVLPVKSKKIKVRDRFLNYVLVADAGNRVLLNRRNDNDIWKGLFEFSLIESDRQLNEQEILSSTELRKLIRKPFHIRHASAEYKHLLSHQRLFAKFYVLKSESFKHSSTSIVCEVDEISSYAFPRLIEKFLADCDLKEIL